MPRDSSDVNAWLRKSNRGKISPVQLRKAFPKEIMTPERWRQIEDVFHEVLDLPNAERLRELDARCAEDAELRAEVEKLVSQYDEASSFIEQPLMDSTTGGFIASLLDDSDEDPMIGKLLGAYRIDREIGRGGMGAVYEAYRADGEFRLRVALKVVKRGVDTDFVLRRFRNERQILAALDHPFITRLIDGGTTDDGRPYFVMEFIDGLTLYRYCDQRRLTIDERLELFCRVCEAVEYAHEKQIIHRDLKPSNIFVTNDGQPRLLDFGIAKLLDPEMASDTLQPTATALRMMTVDYASPEQVRGEKVTYATDVYSLGVILFELLTGRRPYKIKSRSPHDVAKEICDDEPVMPSIAISSSSVDLPSVKVNPSATTLAGTVERQNEKPAQAAERLRGDLDTIILKALRKEAGDRYGTVAAFREDIERHLKGEVVAAERSLPIPKKMIDDAEAGVPSLAVLPLSMLNPTGEESTDEAYLTVGVADAIITRLTSVQRLTVRPTSSITRYNEHNINPFRAGAELGVDYILDGRIRRFGERIRISLQLLDVIRAKTIWAGQFDEHLTDVLELEDAISEQVAAALIPHLTGEDRQKLSKRGTNDPRAYEAYLRGRFYWNQFTSQSLPKALEAYKTAVRLDPNYAQAHSAIAEFYIWAGIYGLIPTVEAYRYAWDFVHSALSLDPELAEAHAANGLLLNNEFRFGPAEKSFLRSIALNPQYSLAREWYGALLIGTGRIEEGIDSMLLAEELDPMSLRTKILVVWCYYQANRLDDALRKADEIVSIDPNYPQGHLQRGNLLSFFGRHDEAIAELAKADEMMPESALVEYHYCFTYQRAGRMAEAVRLADSMELRSKSDFVKPYFLSMANLAAGRIERAYELLEVALAERDAWLVWIGTEPNLRVLHGDDRFNRIIAATKRELVNGRVRTIDVSSINVAPTTSERISEAVTASLDDSPTIETRSSFLKRHRWGVGLGAVVLLVVGIAYATGILTVSVSRDQPMVLRRVEVPKRSIAALPFVNATGDEANEYIAVGMNESLTNRISQSPDIRVLPRSAVTQFKGSTRSNEDIGHELGVENILTGVLSKNGENLELKIEMTHVADGRKLLSLGFVEGPDRILALQEMMSARVVDALVQQGIQTAAAPKSYTENNEAFSLYLKGEFSRQKGTPAGTTESIELYKRALDADPNYALAYQGLALAYRSAPAYGSMTPQEAYTRAKEAAQTALGLDPTLNAAHVSLASVKATYDWDFDGAEREYKQAIQLGPNNPEAHYSYGNFLVAMGRTDEALNELRIAQQIDPLSLNIPTNIGWALYIAGRYDEALVQIRQVNLRDPSFARAYMNLGEILQEQGKFDEAITALQKAKELSKDALADMALGHAYAVANKRPEALKIAVDLEEKVRSKEVSPFLPAVVYAGLNEKDKAFYWLERAYQERSNWLTLIKVGRRLKNLHGDPRFDDLLKRVGFETQKL